MRVTSNFMNIILDMPLHICRFRGQLLIRMHDKARRNVNSAYFASRVTFPRRIRRRKWDRALGMDLRFCVGKIMSHPLYLIRSFRSIFFNKNGRVTTVTIGPASLKKEVRYKSRRPILFYYDVIIGELPRKPPAMFKWILRWIYNNCKRFRIYITF